MSETKFSKAAVARRRSAAEVACERTVVRRFVEARLAAVEEELADLEKFARPRGGQVRLRSALVVVLADLHAAVERGE